MKAKRKANPSGDVFCYHCKKPITGKSVRVVPSNLHGQLLGDFGKSFHPACYKKAQDYSRKKNPIGMYTVGTDLYGRSMLHGWDSEEDAQSAIDDSPLGDGVTMGTTTYHRPATRSDVARLKYDQDGNAVGAEFIGNYRAPVNGPRKKNPAKKSPGGAFKRGERVELHPATDAWMRGDRYGEVTGYGRKAKYRDRETGEIVDVRPVLVKLDKSGKVRRYHPESLSPI